MAKLIKDTSLKIQNLSAVEVERIEPLDLMRLFRTVWYGKWTILFTTWVAIALGGYYAFAIAQPQFAATATLRVETDNEPMVDMAAAVAGFGVDQASINTEVAILRSEHLLAQVVDQMDLIRDPEFNRYLTPVPALSLTSFRTRLRNALSGQADIAPEPSAIMEKTIQNLRNAITAGTQRDTYIFQITATTGSADKSARIANTLAQIYLADQVTAKHGATETAVTWLSERVYDLQLDLQAKETAINDLITTARVHDDAVLDALSRQSIETGQRLAEARRALAQGTASVVSASGQPATPTRDTQRLTSQIAALEIFQTSLTDQLTAQSAGLIQLQQLRREADATRVIYETFLARLQETRIQRGLQNPDSRILSLANPGQYVAPRKMLILAIAALLGGLAGLGWVLARHALQTGFNDASSLTDATDLPVIGQIPKMPLRRRGQLLDYLHSKPASAAAEAIRNLRTSLLSADDSKLPQVILSTSSIPGEGKTTHSVALAQNLSGLGRSVLLVDADARQSAFHHHFLQHAAIGLDAIIAGKATLEHSVVHDSRLNADILTAPKTLQNPADIFFDVAFATFMAELRNRYDHIIIDAPPVLPVPDARLLSQHADVVIYAVAWRRTPAHLVQAGVQELINLNAPIAGLILSQIDTRKMRQTSGAYFGGYGTVYYQN